MIPVPETAPEPYLQSITPLKQNPMKIDDSINQSMTTPEPNQNLQKQASLIKLQNVCLAQTSPPPTQIGDYGLRFGQDTEVKAKHNVDPEGEQIDLRVVPQQSFDAEEIIHTNENQPSPPKYDQGILITQESHAL